MTKQKNIVTVNGTHYIVDRPMLDFSESTYKFTERRPVLSADGILLGWLDSMPLVRAQLELDNAQWYDVDMGDL